jgi:hypothetical protein
MADEYMFSDVNLGGFDVDEPQVQPSIPGLPANYFLGIPDVGIDEPQVQPSIPSLSVLSPAERIDLFEKFKASGDTGLSDEQMNALEKYIYSGASGQFGGAGGAGGFGNLLGNKNLLSAGLGGLGALAAYKSAKDAMQQAKGAKFESRGPVTATRTAFKGTKYSAAGGGIGSLDMAQGGRALPPRYLNGHSDGMADKVPASIDRKRPAALSDGEFVIPADVVSHLGNGNSNAGAKRLYEMMDRIRHARTGNPKQGKQINPDKFMPR